MPSEPYRVAAEPAVSDDLRELAAVDEELVDVAIRLMLALRDDPWAGEDLRERYNLRAIKDCRKLRFDLPNWKGKPRYRLVYRNEPEDGAPEIVRLLAVGTRESLAAYRSAATRLGNESRGRRKRGSE